MRSEYLESTPPPHTHTALAGYPLFSIIFNWKCWAWEKGCCAKEYLLSICQAPSKWLSIRKCHRPRSTSKLFIPSFLCDSQVMPLPCFASVFPKWLLSWQQSNSCPCTREGEETSAVSMFAHQLTFGGPLPKGEERKTRPQYNLNHSGKELGKARKS